MAIDVSKRQAGRLRVLGAIFDAAGGIESEPARVAPTIQMQLELSNQEIQAAPLRVTVTIAPGDRHTLVYELDTT